MSTDTNSYMNPRLTLHATELYTVRSLLLAAVRQALPLLHGRLLDIGCGDMPYRQMILSQSKVNEYVGLDVEERVENAGVVLWDGRRMPFEDATFDCALSTEVIEHVFEPAAFLAEAFRALKPGGLLFLTAPFLWPLHEIPGDACRHTCYSLRRLLENAGFQRVETRPLGGWHASMAQFLGLWAVNGVQSHFWRRLALRAARLAIPWLLKIDRKPETMRNHTMVTGWSCLAWKPPS